MLNFLKKLIILGALLAPTSVFAQCIVVNPTEVQVLNTIASCLPTTNANEISALALRQTLDTMTSAIFNNGNGLSLSPFSVACNSSGITTTAKSCSMMQVVSPLQINNNVLSFAFPPPLLTVDPPLQLCCGGGELFLAGLTGGVLAGSGPAFTVTPTINGPMMVGSVAYAGGGAGDLSVSRTSAPTTGVIFLGNSGSHYIYFDGGKYDFTAGLSAIGAIVSIGDSGGYNITNRVNNTSVASLFSTSGELSLYLFGSVNSNGLTFNTTTGAASFVAGVTATGYTVGASAGVSCSVGTLNPTTAVVTNGIITHC